MGVKIVNFGLKFSKIRVTPTPKFYVFGKLWKMATRPEIFVDQRSERKKSTILEFTITHYFFTLKMISVDSLTPKM